MGCKCCRMIKSYIYDPSVPVDVHGSKRDPIGGPLYQSHQLPDDVDRTSKKQGFHNLGYTSSSGSPGVLGPNKLDIDNNHINRLHANLPSEQSRPTNHPRAGGGVDREDPSLYILQPKTGDLREPPPLPSEPPVYHISLLKTDPGTRGDRFRDSGLGNGGLMEDSEDGYRYREDDEERESGVASTPDYIGDTADEESVLSGDIHTSSTSLSSADTKDGKLSLSKREGVKENAEEDNQSVTDSMVAEALAALEAATAGEEYE
ncbi:uncharacterized protein LOC115817145 [Chanos chanos]|uniref:Uncharacterized protein LOC115817145 n=1 Tax=Chanos chanos TaxID=29144 RepID=A0A6J2VYU4_CHACN|nr:uncharacterized protein LOC115817145 [Chanos chanos]